MNYFWWAVLLLINFGAVLMFFKFFGKAGLLIWIAIAAILANIQVLKTVELFSLVVTLGNIIYGTSFLATDILSELYGEKEARRGVMVGLLTLVVMTVIMQVCLQFIPHASDFAQGALETIFGFMPRIAAASLIAYFVSQMHDVWAYQFWRERFPADRQIWIRNNLSTIISQLIDSIIFTFIAFWGVFEPVIFREILLTTYVLKLIIAILDTPFIYWARRIYQRAN